jgi:hypothetical protein
MRRAIALLVGVGLSAGCAGAGPVERGKPAAKAPVPAECVDAVRRAARVGEVMYREDSIAAWATDALFDEKILPGDKRVRGWVSTREGGRWDTHFLGETDGTIVELYTVHFAEPSKSAARVSRMEPPRPPAPDVATMFRARQTAAREPFRACTAAYNTIVLPASLVGESGWLVYLLASTTTHGEVVVGGHVRRIVSQDGERVVRSEPMSKDCLNAKPVERNGQKLVAIAVNNLVWPCPLEVHVWLSLMHGKDIIVGTRTGFWLVEGTTVRYMFPVEEKPSE